MARREAMTPSARGKGASACVDSRSEEWPWASGRAPRDRHGSPLCGEAASGSRVLSVQPPLCSHHCSGVGAGHPQAPAVPTPDPGRRKGKRHALGCRAVCSGETLGATSRSPCQLSPHSRGEEGSGGKAREWRGWAGGERSGRLAARDLACGAQQGRHRAGREATQTHSQAAGRRGGTRGWVLGHLLMAPHALGTAISRL